MADDHIPSKRDISLGAVSLFVEIVLSFGIAIIVKKLEPGLSIAMLLFFRYLLCLPLLLIFGFYQRGLRLYQINNMPALGMRIISGIIGLSMWFLAISSINLSLATAFSQTMPIFITILAALIIGEAVGLRLLGTVAMGFVGVLVLLHSATFMGDMAFLQWGVFFALAAPFFSALMFVYLRVLGKGDAPISATLWYNSVGSILLGGLLMMQGEIIQTFSHSMAVWWMLIAIGAIASLQQILMAVSHAYAPASVLAPVHYTAIPLGILFGVIFFGETFNLSFFIGTGIILLSNYYIFKRARVKA